MTRIAEASLARRLAVCIALVLAAAAVWAAGSQRPLWPDSGGVPVPPHLQPTSGPADRPTGASVLPSPRPLTAGLGDRPALAETPWNVLVLIYPNSDFWYKDAALTWQRFTGSLTSTQTENLRLAALSYVSLANTWSNGGATITADFYIISRALSSVTERDPGKGYSPTQTDVDTELDLYMPLENYDSVIVLWHKGTAPADAFWGLARVGPITHDGRAFTYATVYYGSDYFWTGKYPGEVIVHEWLHGLEGWYRNLKYEVPDLHSAESHGYSTDGDGSWKAWYTNFMRGLVEEPDRRTFGISYGAWLAGSIYVTNRPCPAQALLPQEGDTFNVAPAVFWAPVPADEYYVAVYRNEPWERVSYTNTTNSGWSIPEADLDSNESYTWICWAKKDGVYAKEGDRRGFNIGVLPSDSFQPDGMVRKTGEASYAGNDVYNTTGDWQSKNRTVKQLSKALYQAQIQNDGTAKDRFLVTGDAGGANWTVKYVQNGTDITGAVTGSGWETPLLAVGGSLVIDLEVTPLAGALGGAAKTVRLTTTSRSASEVDVVRTKTTCQIARKPDLAIRAKSSSTYTGDNIYNTTATNQTVTKYGSPGWLMVYVLRLQNDGNVKEPFLITAQTSGTAMTIRYYNAATGGSDITSQVTGGGWTSSSLNPGATQGLRVEVTIPSSATDGQQNAVLVTATSSGDSSRKDAVKAVTKVDADSGAGGLAGLSATPTRAGAEVTFTLTGAADVSATVLNLAGRPVKRLQADQATAAGTHRLLWNAMGDNGLPVPAGRYLIEVTARAADGSASRALATVMLGR